MTKYENKNYPNSDLTKEIISCSFDVFNELHYGLRERNYQNALASEFEHRKIEFIREKYKLLKYKNKIIGKYYLDFLVEGVVAVELKVRSEIYSKDVSQLLNYLKAENIETGLLIVFSPNGVKIKRLINQRQSE